MRTQAGFSPPEWLPLLQAAVAASRSPEDEETARAFQLLQTAAETGDTQVGPARTQAASAQLSAEASSCLNGSHHSSCLLPFAVSTLLGTPLVTWD